MTKEQQIKIQRCIDEFYSNRPQVRDELGVALQVLYEAEPKHGRWIVNNETEEWVTIYCDQCHDGMWNRKGDPYPNYCFNCGARMSDEVE